MRITLERVSGPAIEPVTLAQMRTHLRAWEDITDDDDAIEAIYTAAREWVEDYTGRALIEQTWRMTVDRRIENGPRGRFEPFLNPENGYGWYQWEAKDQVAGWILRRSPVIAITSFVTVDAEGTETAVDADGYRLEAGDSKWPSIFPVNSGLWTGNMFRVTFRAGFAPGLGSPDPTPDRADVPQRYIQAMNVYATALYDQPENMAALIDTAERLVKSERVDISMA